MSAPGEKRAWQPLWMTRAVIGYARCTRRQNPALRLFGWHCWRCRRAFKGGR